MGATCSSPERDVGVDMVATRPEGISPRFVEVECVEYLPQLDSETADCGAYECMPPVSAVTILCKLLLELRLGCAMCRRGLGTRFKLQDLNSNGWLEELELIELNEIIAVLHHGDDVDREVLQAKYRQLYRSLGHS